MDAVIGTVESLECQVGARPPVADLKVIDHLDAHAQRWLAASPLAFAGFSDAQHIDATLAGGAPGFAAALDPGRLCLPRGLLDDPQQAQPGRGAGLLFLIPGLGETLRVNGRIAAIEGEKVIITVQECYAHCAKALMRSAFWEPATTQPPGSTAQFVAACRYMALVTADAMQRTDVSPKGDPAGLLVQATADHLCFADRPGNRRTDSFRNLLDRPWAAAVLVVPGCNQVVTVRGQARLTADATLREQFRVEDKTPALVTVLEQHTIMLRDSAALERAAPWVAPQAPADIDPAAIFAAHVRLNKGGGLRAALARSVVSIPGLMRKGLAQDYKRNLY